MYADEGGLLGVAASLSAAAEGLSAAAATPLTHPPLAANEVSTSGAGRLIEHGVVLASRAHDGAAVLRSAASAVQEALRAYTDMTTANASFVSLNGDPGYSDAAMTPAVTIDAPAAFVPITPAPARSGEVSAAILEAGSADAGAPFVAGCQGYREAFRASAVAVRHAQSALPQALTGQAGPQIAAALGRFASWADDMSTHSDTVATLASGHEQRFQIVKHDTPPTQAVTNKRRELDNALALAQRYPGIYAGLVAKLQTDLNAMQSQAGFAATNHYLTELPAAPPPPPPVVSVVSPTAPTARNEQPGVDDRDDTDPADDPVSRAAGGDDSGDPLGDPALGNPALADPALVGPGADPASQAGSMASMVPSMLAGALGGALGMVSSIPQAIGQQVQSLASQATQAVQGLASGLAEPDANLDTSDYTPDELGDLPSSDLGSGADAGDGSTEPTAVPGTLAPSSSGMLAMGAPSVSSTPVVGQAAPGVVAAAATGGMPMMPFMPMAPGGGAGGTRPPKEPDKTIHLPPEPNSEPVQGEVMRRETTVAEDPIGENKRKPVVSVSVSSSRRRIELPEDGSDNGV